MMNFNHRYFLFLIILTLIGCATTPIKSLKDASPVKAENIFYKSEGSVNNVIFVRDNGFYAGGATAYLFMKMEPSFENIKLANLEAGEMAGFSLKEGEYVFMLEFNPLLGHKRENEISLKIESNKTYFYRIFPMGWGDGFYLQRTSLNN